MLDWLQFVLAPQVVNGLSIGVAVVLMALGLGAAQGGDDVGVLEAALEVGLQHGVRAELEEDRVAGVDRGRYGGGEVSVELLQRPGGRVELRVCDRGPGVPPEVESLLAGHIHIAWNTPLGHVRVKRRTGGQSRSLGVRCTDGRMYGAFGFFRGGRLSVYAVCATAAVVTAAGGTALGCLVTAVATPPAEPATVRPFSVPVGCCGSVTV